MPYPSEHSARLRPPGRYRRFRRENDKFGSGIHAIWGVRKDNEKVELQAIRFDKKKFTAARAKKWLKDRDYEPIRFEPASGKTADVPSIQESPAAGDRSPGAEENAMTIELDALLMDPTKRTYGKTATYRKALDPAKAYVECKAESPTSKNGIVEGYASVWNVVDHQGEIVRKGAFTKTIQERGSKIPLMIQHFANGGDILEAVGGTVELTENDYGLKFAAEFLDDEKSQAVRQKILALRKQDLKIGTSIGYRVIKYGFITDDASGKTYVELTELALGELTATLKPANESALVTGAKSTDDHQTILAPFAAIQEAKVEDLDDEAKTQIIENVYGDAEKAKSLADALKGIAEKTLVLLPDESQDVGAKDGDASPAGSSPDNQGTSADDGSTTEAKIVAHRRERHREIERRRLAVMRRRAGSVE